MPDTRLKTTESQRLASSSPSLERGLAMLEHLSKHPLGRTLSELAAALEAPAASVLRMGRSLEELGYVDRDLTTKRYSLTNKFLRLGQPVTGDRGLSECAIGPMREIRRATGETTQLCCLIDTDMVIVEQLMSTHPFKYSADIGARCPLQSCAPGKAIAAFLPDDEREALVDRIRFRRFTDRTIVTKRGLNAEFASIRERGYAVDRSEGLIGIHCVATPILDRHQVAVAAITIAAPADRLREDEFDSIGQLMRKAARPACEALNG